MQSLRDTSQQDRRVYVGNLSYDVKWHHLKDFMRQGEHLLPSTAPSSRPGVAHFFSNIALMDHPSRSRGSSLRQRTVTSRWNVEGGRHHVDVAGLSGLLLVI